jgi:RNA recognition motif-containing protein
MNSADKSRFGYSFEDEEENEEYSLFLSNIASTINKENLHEIFRDYGKISKIILQHAFINAIEQVGNDMEEENNSFGFGIISFQHVSSVFDALMELGEDDDFSLMGQKLR